MITADGVTPSIDLGHYVIERSAEPGHPCFTDGLGGTSLPRGSVHCERAFV